MVNSKVHVIYSAMVLIFVGMICFMCIQYKGPSLIDESFSQSVDFSSGWKTKEGLEVDISSLSKLEYVRKDEEFWAYHDIPEHVQAGEYLCFRSKNVFFSVYCDGVLKYEPYYQDNIFYTKSGGTRWNYVPITEDMVGKRLEVCIIKKYQSGKAGFDHMVLGQPARMVIQTVQEKVVAFVTCILILFVGIFLMIADIPINMQNQKNHELLYLGLFSISVATWCLSESHLLQFFYGDSRMLQVLSCGALTMISIPLMLYLNSAFGFRFRGVMYGMVTLSVLSFVAALVLHVTKIADVHETLFLSHIMLSVSAVVLFVTSIRNTWSFGKNVTRNVYRVLRGIGLCSLSVATLIDVVRFYQGTNVDSAMFVRIGLLIFIICFGSSSLEKTINAVKLGVQTELISQLAYRDGLTQIGNRTAFEERIIDLQKEKENGSVSQIGIMIFDVNDLKFINDNFGHQIGDNMLMDSAKIIKESFESVGGECYRVGGDEFAVLLYGDKVSQQYEAGITMFLNLQEQYNQILENEYRISIAYGFAQYNQAEHEKMFMNVYKQADMLMYENKKQMKLKETSAEEFYQTGVLS